MSLIRAAASFRLHLLLAGVFGASGVGLWAYAVHAGQASAAIAAQMLLIHAAALAGLSAARRAGLLPERAGGLAITALACGVLLFSGDLALRALAGMRLFPMASPLGGVTMMASWLAIGLLGALKRGG